VTSWSFLTSHAQALLCIAHDPSAQLRDIAASPDITERSAHGIVTDLTAAGYVIKQENGRCNCYQIHLLLPEPATAAEHATGMCRLLAETYPDAFEPDLACSLNNLGIRLAALGQRQGALIATEEATQICRQLATANPGAFELSLANSLKTCAEVRITLRAELQEALDFARASVVLYQRRASHLPAAPTAELVRLPIVTGV